MPDWNENVDFELRWSELVAKSWADDDFKKRLLSNPAEVLRENGVAVPTGTTLKIIENTGTTVYLILPTKPEPLQVSTQVLNSASVPKVARSSSGRSNFTGGCRIDF